MALREQGRFDEALRDAERALALEPGSALACNAHGIVLDDLGRYDEAPAAYEAAIAVAPDFAEAHNNLGNALHDLARYDDALAALDRAIALRPGYAEAESNRGWVLQETRRFDDAATAYDAAIAHKPTRKPSSAARRCACCAATGPRAGRITTKACVLRGDRPAIRCTTFPLGRAANPCKASRSCSRSPTASAMRCSSALHSRVDRYGRGRRVPGAIVVVPVTGQHPWSVRLLSTLSPSDRLPISEQRAVEFAPRLLRTTVDTIPGGVPYSPPNLERMARWAHLAPKDRFQASALRGSNPSRKIDVGRSIPLAEFAPLCDVPGVNLVSLQRTHGLEQLRALPAGMAVVEPRPGIRCGRRCVRRHRCADGATGFDRLFGAAPSRTSPVRSAGRRGSV